MTVNVFGIFTAHRKPELVLCLFGQEDSLCLADVCEVFRCDVIGRNIIPDFWDVALCLEDDMKSLHRKCAVSVCPLFEYFFLFVWLFWVFFL